MTTILSFDDAFGGGKAKIPRSSVTGDIGFAVISRLNRFKTLEAGRDDSAVVNDSAETSVSLLRQRRTTKGQSGQIYR